MNMIKAKPFIKWVGGKSQLLEQLDAQLPVDFADWKDATYIEPFVGGGAMLFYMLQHYQNINHVVINDINTNLTICYSIIRNNPAQLILSLMEIEKVYLGLSSEEERRQFYLKIRDKYNNDKIDALEITTMFIFLNRTCFNGLYRVNKSGAFNVPFGRYENPIICNPDLIRKDSETLQKVEILNGDFENTFTYASNRTLFYFDPPYRPLSNTSNFNDYTKDSFNDTAQVRLKEYCDKVHSHGFHFMLSNSDGRNQNETEDFFDRLYSNYHIERVWASRSINSNTKKRGRLTEILVRNYQKTKKNSYVEFFKLEPYTTY